jgi:hypothetical protein
MNFFKEGLGSKKGSSAHYDDDDDDDVILRAHLDIFFKEQGSKLTVGNV